MEWNSIRVDRIYELDKRPTENVRRCNNGPWRPLYVFYVFYVFNYAKGKYGGYGVAEPLHTSSLAR